MHMVQCLLPPHVNCSKKTLGKHKDEHVTIIERITYPDRARNLLDILEVALTVAGVVE